jgi:Na+-driven multidrug efflux pump
MSEVAARVGGQALWLSVPLSLAVAAGVFAFAAPITTAMGADGETATLAIGYLRIAAVVGTGGVLA